MPRDRVGGAGHDALGVWKCVGSGDAKSCVSTGRGARGNEMTTYKDKYRVGTARLPGWDYSSHGYYFLTICTKGHVHYFGDIVGGEMTLSDLGRVARDCWTAIPEHFPFALVDERVVTPNNVHGIVIIPPHGGNSMNTTVHRPDRRECPSGRL